MKAKHVTLFEYLASSLRHTTQTLPSGLLKDETLLRRKTLLAAVVIRTQVLVDSITIAAIALNHFSTQTVSIEIRVTTKIRYKNRSRWHDCLVSLQQWLHYLQRLELSPT